MAASVLLSGCELRGLARDELFGRGDAGGDLATEDGALGARDAALDASEADATVADATVADAAVADAAVADAAVADAAVADAAVAEAAVTGTGHLSGTVSACGLAGDAPAVQVAIAGRRKCSYPEKGSYFFSALPAGKLRLAALKDGYELFEADVVIDPAGTTFNIDLVPAAPYTCASLPPKAACACTDPTCEP